MSTDVFAKDADAKVCPAARKRSAMPRWSRISMVREWKPRARMPTSSEVERLSTTCTSTPASASSPASISPVGPAPATITSTI